MNKRVAAIALLAFLPATGSACSMYRSPEFYPRAATQTTKSPPQLQVRKVNFVAQVRSDTSCDGIGFITIELSGPASRDIDRYGVFIREQAGSNGEAPLPTHPIKPTRAENGAAILHWAWTSLSADADGEVRWKLELVPVSRSGMLGTPIPLCVASDDSCPPLAGDRP